MASKFASRFQVAGKANLACLSVLTQPIAFMHWASTCSSLLLQVGRVFMAQLTRRDELGLFFLCRKLSCATKRLGLAWPVLFLVVLT